MSKLSVLIEELCPQGVEYKPLGKVAEYVKDRRASDGLEAAKFVGVDNLLPNFQGVDVPTYGPNAARVTAFQEGDLLIGNIRPYLKKIWLANYGGGCSGDVLALRITERFSSLLDTAFLYRVLASDSFFDFNMKHARGGKMPRGDKQMILRYEIPIPPMEVQQEIVRVLDALTDLEQSLVVELELRKKQFNEYLPCLLQPSHSSVTEATLADIGAVKMCKRVLKRQTAPEGDIPFFKIGSFGGEADAFISKELFDEYREKYSFPKVGDILISAAGTIGRTVKYDGTPAYFQDSNIVWVDNDETLVTNDFLYYWYKLVKWTTDSGTIKRLYNKNLLSARISYPSLAEQHEIVAKLDAFESLIQSIEQEIALRRKQYEFYRDELLRFTPREA